MAKSKTPKLTPKQRIQIYEALKEVLMPSSAKEGLFEYKQDYNDRKIAELSGATFMQVAYLRSQLFGKLYNAAGYVPIPEIITRLKDAEARIARLEYMTVPRSSAS